MSKKKYLCGIVAAAVLLMSCPVGAMAVESEKPDIIMAQETGSIWFDKNQFNPTPHFSSLSEAWKALNEGYQITVNDNEGTTYLPQDQLSGQKDTDEMWYLSLEDTFPKNDLITIYAVADSTVDNNSYVMSDDMNIDRLLAIKFGSASTYPSTAIDTILTFNGKIIIKENGALTIQNAYANVYDVAMGTLTFTQPIMVEDGGKLNVNFVCSAGDNQEGPKVVYSGTESPLITIADGGSASLKNMDITAKNSNEPLIEVNGELEVDITPHMSIEPTISTNGTAISVSENATLKLSGGKIENTDGKPAISVAENATLNIPEGSTAQITTNNENGQAIDLAGGSTVKKGDTTITVGKSDEGDAGGSYVDNNGNIILGANSTVTDSNNNVIPLPNGGSVDQNGTVQEKPVSVTGVTLDKTSLSLYEGDTVTLTATVMPENATNKNVTWSSDNTAVATVENGNVKAVSRGTATITVTTTDGNHTGSCTVTVSRESSGGDGSSSTTYAVSVEDGKNGSVSVSPKRAEKGDTVTITVKPDTGYELDELTVTEKNGDSVKLTKKSDTQYTFTMPASKVEIQASFKAEDVAPTVPSASFTDIPSNAYYADAVAWAVEKGITNGTSDTTFSPDATCTRAQVVTFLWRAAGSPAVSSATGFTDVDGNSYYAQAVAWAVANGITNGTSATTFSPDAVVTRAQVVTFLWRYEGSKAAGTRSGFADVDAGAYYAGAVDWAVEHGITQGTSNTTFSPDADCTRGQIVTFLYRDMAK